MPVISARNVLHCPPSISRSVTCVEVLVVPPLYMQVVQLLILDLQHWTLLSIPLQAVVSDLLEASARQIVQQLELQSITYHIPVRTQIHYSSQNVQKHNHAFVRQSVLLSAGHVMCAVRVLPWVT